MTPQHFWMGPATPMVRIEQDASGAFHAEIVGLSEIRAVAPTREEALDKVRETVSEWVAAGRLVALGPPRQPPLSPAIRAIDDELDRQYLAELARMRQEDLERTLREYELEDQGCSNTSSTPTT